jgi:hypothetical protein
MATQPFETAVTRLFGAGVEYIYKAEDFVELVLRHDTDAMARAEEMEPLGGDPSKIRPENRSKAHPAFVSILRAADNALGPREDGKARVHHSKVRDLCHKADVGNWWEKNHATAGKSAGIITWLGKGDKSSMSSKKQGEMLKSVAVVIEVKVRAFGHANENALFVLARLTQLKANVQANIALLATVAPLPQVSALVQPAPFVAPVAAQPAPVASAAAQSPSATHERKRNLSMLQDDLQDGLIDKDTYRDLVEKQYMSNA